MLQRTLHSLATLVAIIIAYQCYVLVAVPWLEPPLALRGSRPATGHERNQAEEAVTKYQRLLAAYFPADHWSLTQPPKVIENGQVMLVLDDYTLHDDGRVDIDHCAVLVFPTPRTESPTPPRDAIIIEAPQGAKLQFDEEFSLERMQIGQITQGEFPGRITIRSDMHDPGPEDDLLVETRDLKMNSKLLFSEHEVRFRLGPNVGGGRDLEIRLLEADPSPSDGGGLKIAGIDRLDIRRDVWLRAFLGTDSLLPGIEKPGSHAERGNEVSRNPRRLPPTEQQPVTVTCTGPFGFDFVKYIASFDENVEVRQANPKGQSDQLNCEQLDIHFARKSDVVTPDQPWTDRTGQQGKDMRSLEPVKIVARGYPVVAVSPSRGAEARGGRLQLLPRTRKVILDGGQDVRLVSGPNVLRAPAIQYQHPADDASTKIGSFRADGPGMLHYVPDPDKPAEVFRATWQASVELGRHNGQPVLTLAGRPRLGVAQMGQLTADQVRVYLRELETDGKTRPIPDRLNAVGQVEIDSPELLAETRELLVTFRVEPDVETASPLQRAGEASADAGRFNFARNSRSAARVYQVSADELALEVGLRGRRAVPTRLECNHNVTFRELADPYAAARQPFEVRGGQLIADRLDADTRITIHGAPPNALAAGQLAQIQARGMTIQAADVQLDQRQNRLWIDGPGTATMLVRRDLSGRETGTPYPLEIHWQGGLEFDGRNVMFRRNVSVAGTDDRVHCDLLTATLSKPIEFGKRVDQEAIDLAEIECRGNVVIDHKVRDEVGLTSHDRLELARVTVNQQTGVITGDGPGVIRSTHFASSLAALAGPAAAGTASPPRAARLQFLRVDFQGGLAGNLYTREIEFLQRVRAVYGPVDAWEQELDMNRHESLPPDTITLTSEELRINEDPIASRTAASGSAVAGKSMGLVQMHAEGNVRIDNQSSTQGKFAATAQRAAYEQAKELFILEGPPQTPATIRYQTQVGGQFIQQVAERIQFHRLTNRVVIEGGGPFEFTPGDKGTALPQNARGPAPPVVR